MATELAAEAEALSAQGNAPASILSSKMMGAVEGHAWNKSRKADGSVAEIAADEKTDRAYRAEKALRKAVHDGYENPTAVVKGMSPSFAAEYGLFLSNSGRVDPVVQSLQTQVELLSAELGKNFTTSSPLSTGLVPFDLEQPSKLIYWFDTPLRAKIPRTKGAGTSHRTKIVTAISGGQGAQGVVDISSAEATTFTSFANTGQSGAQTSVDLQVSYQFQQLSESLSWLSQWAGQGFEDITALANLILMQEFHFGEEYLNIAGSATSASIPTIASCTARTAGTGEVALSAFTTSINVSVTAMNYFGETAPTVVTNVAVTTGSQVVDVVITPGAVKGQQYRIYVNDNLVTPHDRTKSPFMGQTGGTKFTLQGAVPTALTNLAPVADTGTGKAGRYEGILSCLSGNSQAISGYPAGHLAGYVNQNVQDTLNYNVITNALQQVYNGPSGFRASPTEILCDGIDATSLSKDVAKNTSGTNYQLLINQNEMAGITHGTAVSQVTNPVTRKTVDITVHPGWLQGTAAFMSWTTPSAIRNSNVFEMVMVQDLLSVAWPVIDPTYRFSMFQYGALVPHAPQYCALLQGLQASASNPWK